MGRGPRKPALVRFAASREIPVTPRPLLSLAGTSAYHLLTKWLGKVCFVKLEIEGEVVEEFFGPSFLWQKQQIHFHQLLNLIEAARLHRSVQSLILIIKPTAIGWGQIEEIHRLLARFHADGKRSYAYLEHADNKSYYLAAGAQKIYLSPATTLELVGLRLEVLYFKKLLDYLGIEPEVVQIGAYKSAAEPFDREGMSEQQPGNGRRDPDRFTGTHEGANCSQSIGQ